jgi:hypothetical protein
MKKYKIIYADPPWSYQNGGVPEGTEGWDVWGDEVESDIALTPKNQSKTN